MSPPEQRGSRSLLILSPTPGRGGAEEYLLTIARAAREDGWRVTVAIEGSAETRSLLDELDGEPGIAAIDARLRVDHRGGALRQMLTSAATILRLRPGAVLIVLPWPTIGVGAMVAAALAPAPSAVVFQLAPWSEPVGRWRTASRWAQRRGQRWIAVSEANAAVIAGIFGVGREAITIIYNGASPARRPPGSADPGLREELGLAPAARIALTVGRLDVQKGYADLLAVLPEALGEDPGTVFVWAGDGPLRAELEASIVRHGLTGRVFLLGHRTDVPALLDSADLFILPSRFEGLPFALLEAMAHGRPVLTSDAGGSSEVVRAGIDGLVYPEGDRTALADRLRWALRHPAEMAAMGASASARAAEFSEERMLRETLAALDALMTRERSR